jgi:hypothetical protein
LTPGVPINWSDRVGSSSMGTARCTHSQRPIG